MGDPERAAYCRARAAECERKSQAASSPYLKAAFLETKERWLRYAEEEKAEAPAE